MELTFAMIKPDAVSAHITGKIIDMIEHHGFEIMRMHKVQLTDDAAEEFYAVHKDRPFFKELVEFIVSGPVVILALAKDNAIVEWRKLMGATDPKKADKGTIRQLFGKDIMHNMVHGSDSAETAEQELNLFFVDEMDDEFEYEEEDGDHEEEDEDND